MQTLLSQVEKQASINTQYHCLYAYYWLGFKTSKLAEIYNKDVTTIRRWIVKFEESGELQRKERETTFTKFSVAQRNWLLDLYKEKPILYLREAVDLFYSEFKMTISASQVSLILRDAGLTWKVIERRAMQLQLSDVFRYFEELAGLEWLFQNLIFLDEVSCDNRSMLRKNGYALKGSKLVFRGEFCRKPRSS